MIAFSIYMGVQTVASPLVGRMVDRYGARKIIAFGTIIASLSLILLSQTHTLWFFYASYAVLGAGHVTGGHVPASAIVSNWFRKRRGTAIGIMGVGIGAGGLVIAPLVGGYLIPNFGWSISYLILGIISGVITIPAALLVIKTKPADMQLYPDGIESAEAEASSQALPSTSNGLSLKMVLVTSAFWLIAVSFLLNGFSFAGIVQNQVPHLEGIGFPIATAAAVFGAVGFGSAVGKFGFGWLCDRIPPKYACSIGLGLGLTAIIIFMNVSPASPLAMIWLYAILMGLGVGSWLPTMSMLTSTAFGLASYGATWGLITCIHSAGSTVGPMVAGYIYDTTGTYYLAFIIALALLAVAIATILVIRRPKSLPDFTGK